VKVSSSPISAVAPLTYGNVARVGTPAAACSPAVKVESSGFLESLQAAARGNPFGELRADKVAAARADLAAGRLGSREDLDATVEAFLRGL
jgi:hypothetical protein